MSLSWKPKNLDECMLALDSELSPEDKKYILDIPFDKLSRLHHGLGQWIRNNFDLWKGGPLQDYMKGLGFMHPDDMSAAIIHEWWNRAHNKPSVLQDDIQIFAEYWKKNEA